MHARFEQLLKTLSQVYDLVIIDTPPILPVTDAGIVGRLAGSVFMILKEGEHPMRIIEESVRRLRQSGVQLRGKIGRASWRERVCPYVWISVVAVELKKKN